MAQGTEHPLDGVRPRHTLCPACGYHHGGLEIRGGIIVCPECGATMRFEFARRAVAARVPRPRVTLWLLLAIAMVIAVLYAVL